MLATLFGLIPVFFNKSCDTSTMFVMSFHDFIADPAQINHQAARARKKWS